MVYAGPSDGCHLCRKRRIKCDGGRPGCRRCAIYKADCPGYRAESDYKFVADSRSTAATALATSRKPSKPKAPAPSTDVVALVQSDSDLEAKQVTIATKVDALSALPRVPSTNWEDWSVASFLHDWTLPESSSSMNVGFLEFLPEMYKPAHKSSDIALATRAAALACFANREGSPELIAKARSAYGKSLTALNRSLRDPDESLKDSTIATIVTLQIFEHISCDDSLSMGNHDDGLRMLLQLRGWEQLQTAQGRAIGRIVFGYLFGRSVHQQKSTSEFLRHGCHELGLPDEHPARQPRPPGPGIPGALSYLGSFFGKDPTDPNVVAEAILGMQATVPFQTKFEEWQAGIPESWHKIDLQIPFDPVLATIPTTIPHTGVVHVYSSAMHACTTNMYRMQYRAVQHMLLRLADFLQISDWSLPPSPDFPDGQPQSFALSLAALRTYNEDALASAACAMAEVSANGQITSSGRGRAVGAYYMLSPLITIAHDEFATPEQREDARRALTFIGRVLGVQRGLKGVISGDDSPRLRQRRRSIHSSSESSSSPASSQNDSPMHSMDPANGWGWESKTLPVHGR